jgi:capsular polysaccharide biosynthesis protein
MSVHTERSRKRERFGPHDPLLVPTVTLGSAARRHPWLVVLPMVLLMGIAFAAAYKRLPTYSAQTRLAVGKLDGTTPASVAGFATATEALAETYSRKIRSDAVVAPVARELGINPAAVKHHVSAAPIPQTPVFRVTAKGSSPDQAAILANAVSESLAAHVARESASAPRSARLLRGYRQKRARLEDRRAEVEQAQRRYFADETNANRRRLGDARVRAAALELELRGLTANYAASRQTRGSTALVEVLEHADRASSDRYRVMQFLVFVAAVAGITIGLGLALLRSRRAARRLAG